MEGGSFLDVVVGEGAALLQRLPGAQDHLHLVVVAVAEKLAFVAGRLVQTLDDDVQHRVGGQHLQCLLFIEQGVHEDLHPASLKDTYFDVEVYQSVGLHEWSALAEILESTDQL